MTPTGTRTERRSIVIISEQAMTIVELLWHPGNYHSRENAIKLTQAAIDEATAEKNQEIARLKGVISERSVKHLVGVIKSICGECGHQTAEDGCAHCLKKEIERLKNLLGQVEDYMGHAPICCFKPPDGDRCDCGLWDVKKRINEAIEPATHHATGLTECQTDM